MPFTKGHTINKGHKQTTSHKLSISKAKMGKYLKDKLTYSGIHMWIRKEKGKAVLCTECGSVKNVEWANISGRYERSFSDWKTLCRTCHRVFDGVTKLTKDQVRDIKFKYTKGQRQVALATEYKVNRTTISNVINNKIKFYV